VPPNTDVTGQGLMQDQDQMILFEAGPLGAEAGGTLFRAPVRMIRAETPAGLPAAFAAMEAARAEGLWLAGYASYELGLALDPKLRPLLPDARDVPLLHFAAFEAAEPGTALPAPVPGAVAEISPPEPLWDLPRYWQACTKVLDYIGAGDIYQANLTFPLRAEVRGTPLDLWRALVARQPVSQGALVDLGGPVILSRSPELFFAIKDGVISTRPMKGTLPRSGDAAQDAENARWLAADPKNRAENLMIVDLLRNDLSRISEVGSVKVPALFEVEHYATVLQMVSRVEARVLPGLRLADLFTALFPCGSVTGAPKIRAMQIIHELEAVPRGAYCGSVGWIAPLGSDRAGDMEFNVAIRTLTLPGDGSARLNVGGGVVWDSTPEAEYEEALWKTRYALI
jgi:para-aminobenzoate synthetase component I